MRNTVHTDTSTLANGVMNNAADLPDNIDGFFCGHSFDTGELQILIGAYVGGQTHIRAILDQESAEQLATRIIDIIRAAESGSPIPYIKPIVVMMLEPAASTHPKNRGNTNDV